MTKSHIPDKLMENILTHLVQGEEVIDAQKAGIFGGGDLSVLTTKRHLLISKSISETAYLNDDETIEYYERQQSYPPVSGWVYLLTKLRLLAINLSNANWLVAYYPLADISGLFVEPVFNISGALTEHYRGFKIIFHDGKEQAFYHTGPIFDDPKKVSYTWKSEDQKECEKLPRKICELANLKFSPPFVGKNNTPNEITFYVKSDLSFPKRCAACMKEDVPFKYDVIDPSSGVGQKVSAFATLFWIKFEIPYCQACFQKRFGFLKKDRAVKQTKFDFLVATLQFDNSDYAKEFIEINSEN